MRRKKSHFPWFQVAAVAALAVVATAVTWAAVNKVKSQREQAKAKQEELKPEEWKPDLKKPELQENAVAPTSIPEPKAKSESPRDTWTHSELAEFFNSKGAQLTVLQAGLDDKLDGTLSAAFRQESADAEVVVHLCNGSRSAREVSGALGKNAFTIGRFVVAPRWDNRVHKAELNRQLAAALEAIK